MKTLNKDRISGLDGLRAFSVALVLFAHMANGKTSWSKYGGFGVEVFFVLSGFLITLLLCIEEDKHGAISLPSFYMRRALRIFPPALLYVVCASILSTFGLAHVVHNEPLYCVFFVRNLMVNGGEHLGHFWTLAIEEQFYLLWPLGFLLLRSNRNRLLFSITLFVAAPFWQNLAFRLAGGATNVNSWRSDLRYDALLAGCSLALLHRNFDISWRGANRTSTIAAFLGLLAIVAGCAGLPTRAFSRSLSLIGVAVLIYFSTEREDGLIGRTLNWRPIVWVGRLSYSLYLWQQIFCAHSKLSWLGQFPQNIVAAFVAAALSYYLLEVPLANVRKRLPYFPNPRSISNNTIAQQQLVASDVK